MRPWHYLVAALAAVAIVAFVYTNNRDDESEVAGRADDTSQSTTAGAMSTTLYTLPPNAAIELLLEQSGLPEEVVPGLTAAQGLYDQAMQAPEEEAIALLEQCEDELNQAAEIAGDLAIDASNQVAADNLRRLSASILSISERVQADRESLEGTGTPVPVAAAERIAA